MSIRALCRIFGITLVTWSIVIQTVSGVPIAIAHPQEIKSHENATDKTIQIDKKAISSTEVIVKNTSSQTTENSNLANKQNINKTIHTTIKPYKKASASITALPTSEYVELTSIQNITDLSNENISASSTTDLVNPNDIDKKDKSAISMTVNNSKKAEKKNSTDNAKATRSNFLNGSTSFSDGTTNPYIVSVLDRTTKPDIVSVLDRTTKPDIVSVLDRTTKPDIVLVLDRTTKPDIVSELDRTTKPDIVSVLDRTTKPDIVSVVDRTTKPDIVSVLDRTTKPDIVSVLDNVVNYDSLLSNFLNDKMASNINKQPSNETSTNTITPKTKTAPITGPNWKKYHTIVRKRTTKTMSETPTEVTIIGAAIEKTTTAGIHNLTEKILSLEETEMDDYESKETLKESASTWNQTTISPTMTDSMEEKSVTTTDETHAVLDAAESGVLASKRSGYLDNSKWDKEIYVTTKSPESTTFTEKKNVNANFNNGFKLNSTAKSRQKMIEDALTKEHRESKASVTEQTTTDASSTDYQNHTNSKQNTSINPLLYRVNSNYKPLKKLDVQPHKSFTIDPDDNSWRNESINSRGIVYKPKNSSKPFTQVLKNKTESEWHNLLEKQFKDEEEELKERLEKIAAKRKSKKKLTDDVNNNLGWNGTDVQQEVKFNTTTPYLPVFNQILFTTNSPIDQSSSTVQKIEKSQYDSNAILTEKPMEHLNNADAYDTYEEDERFITEFDLMKTSQTTPRLKTPTYPQKVFVKTEKTTVLPHSTTRYPPNRKGTIEYFPPKSTKMNYNNYDFEFKDKVNTFTAEFMKNRIEPLSVLTTTPRVPRVDKKVAEPSVYIMPPYETKLGNVDDSTYVIKHYKDFVSKAAAEDAHPPSPHSDVVNKFVDSFNRNAEKLKQEFPILYNTNIVHRGGDDGRIVASSSAYLRRLHGSPPPLLDRTRHYDPSCVNQTVELSPAYELHYFVNDEEQKQPPLLDPPIYSDFS